MHRGPPHCVLGFPSGLCPCPKRNPQGVLADHQYMIWGLVFPGGWGPRPSLLNSLRLRFPPGCSGRGHPPAPLTALRPNPTRGKAVLSYEMSWELHLTIFKTNLISSHYNPSFSACPLRLRKHRSGFPVQIQR